MVSLESLFCPCCTPAILHGLAQSNPAMLPRQLMLLGTGALTAVMTRTLSSETLEVSKSSRIELLVDSPRD